MKTYFSALLFISFSFSLYSQNHVSNSPCSDSNILARELINNPNALQENESNIAFCKAFVKQLQEDRKNGNKRAVSQYTIPVVIHVFHHGDTAKVNAAQIQSGLDILNNDMKGLNSDFNTIDPDFDSIKSTLDIEFCLATLDPNGNPTTGVNYYDDSLSMLNETDLFVHAWDNYKYLNIYMPRYTGGSWSLFTAFAYYPSTSGSNNNQGGIFYSSIRWGYGTHSELSQGQEWASVVTHETGHWLNLRHTFENGCNSPGDFIDDTPYCTGGTIELSGCYNNNQTCNENTNGSNYMDYNHDCKKMFTQDQVDWMTAALNLPSRITLWSDSNLIATGCKQPPVGISTDKQGSFIEVFPNPSNGKFTVKSNEQGIYSILDVSGRKVDTGILNKEKDFSYKANGIYFVKYNNETIKLIVNK